MSTINVKKIEIKPKYVFFNCGYIKRIRHRFDNLKHTLKEYSNNTLILMQDKKLVTNDSVDSNIIEELISFQKVNIGHFDGIVTELDEYGNYASVVEELGNLEFCANLSMYSIVEMNYYQTDIGNILYLSFDTESG